ncbi:glycoside hydrolase family 31 protein [Cordyceps fumosorosea ARSEF 2679]|uniref:Probable alpha/beta-glucosidase agdC n=1 Tax=Cordyceps fumosorosea (strain ARSEF 2679) TaxID=1081104 RepID=A0A168CHB7_CORFA|nr:glycoside hydrolase family 31 protein [Cordyceps fumosorosea ARSEF 2679]OAA71376.1 glycoside hydrolase family 31 protein [Cordyceps fumosorosea ARSEF 2679]
MRSLFAAAQALLLVGVARAAVADNSAADKCPGYAASNVKTTAHGLTADLTLAGPACNAFGRDLENLKLTVSYDTGQSSAAERIHVQIVDVDEQVYQVPESVFPRPPPPPASGCHSARASSALTFNYTASPFSFAVARAATGEVLFDSSAAPLVFESQYLRLRTRLPPSPNLYGLGEHTDSLRLPTTSYVRTLWNLDNPGVGQRQNLYGSHPVYYDHRAGGTTHGVFLLNSNGMDVKIDVDAEGEQYLEYNTIGGVLDFYFLAGPSPIDVSKQYAQVAGLPALAPYSGLGFHNCRWGYTSIDEVAEVVANYSAANIPLETMWTDIDYMDGRAVFALDPINFPLDKVRRFVQDLHDRGQKYVMMVDPAVAAKDYPPYHRGVDCSAFMTFRGEVYRGEVWPGPAAYPDWFAANASDYWAGEFARFFDPATGVDIDYLWIDMNEPSNFCEFPCEHLLPRRGVSQQHVIAPGTRKGLPGRDLLYPPYRIDNADGDLSSKTARPDLLHANGLTLYDTHNLYGSMMSSASRAAMLARRPGLRPLVVTRSTFAGAGAHVAHWLGDNASTWRHYLWSVRGMLAFSALFQVPVVGSDVCGFGDDTTEALCARWAMLGAFQPFYRNHNAINTTSQEFYRWESVAQAARKAIDVRYRLLDYFYTALQRQSADGTPCLRPMFFAYPGDERTFALDAQFFYGPALLVAPVVEESSTEARFYLPRDVFYDFYTHERVLGEGEVVTREDQQLDDIPLFWRGGSVVPVRVRAGMTTAEVRGQDFELLVAPDAEGAAEGSLYLDDGESEDQRGRVTRVDFAYEGGVLRANGTFKYVTGSVISKVTVLGGGKRAAADDKASNSVEVKQPLSGPFKIDVAKLMTSK